MRFWPFARRIKVATGRLLALNPVSQLSREYVLLKNAVSLGSDSHNDFVIQHDATSRRHAIIRHRFGRHTITDLASANGTFVNGKRVKATMPLQKGDEIRLGAARFILANLPDAAAQPSVLGGAKRAVSLRALAEMILVAFVAGFGLAQYLAYLSYHQEHAFVLGDAVALPQPTQAQPSVSSSGSAREKAIRAVKPASTPSIAVAASKPVTIPSTTTDVRGLPSRVAEIPKPRKFGAASGGNDFAGAISLSALVPGSGTLAGSLAPAFTLSDLNGSTISLLSLRGKVVFLNVWATWCPVCRREMPALEQLHKDLKHRQDFQLLAVSEDQNQGAVASFIEKNGYTFRVLLDPDNRLEAMYNVRGLPTTLIVNRQGVIVWNVTGGLDWSSPQLRQALEKLL
jgi:peroxiredoxin